MIRWVDSNWFWLPLCSVEWVGYGELFVSLDRVLCFCFVWNLCNDLVKMQRITALKRISALPALQRRYLATVKEVFPNKTDFPSRHIGPRKTEVVAMLDFIGYKVGCFTRIIWHFQGNLHEWLLQSLDELTDKAVPKQIQLRRDLKLDEPFSE